MSEAQGWTLLGIVAAALLAGPTVLLLYLRAALAALSREMEIRFKAHDDVLLARFNGVERRLDGIERRLDAMENRSTSAR